jgi:hypothetical protein
MQPNPISPTKQTTLQAFLIAVSQLETPISDELKQAIHQIGEELERSEDKAIDLIPEIVTQDSCLQKAYREARLNLRERYEIKRDIVYSNSLKLKEIALLILRADNFKSMSQKILRQNKKSKDGFFQVWQKTITKNNQSFFRIAIDKIWQGK